MLGDLTSARQSLEEAQSILRVSDDEASLAWSMQFLGMVYTFQREYTLADAALKEGSRIAKKLDDRYINSFSFYQGDIDLQRGDRSKAKQFYEESANFQRAYGNKAFLAYPLRRLGYMALEQNDIPNAWKYFSESLVLNREVVDKPGVAACLTSMVVLAMHMNRPDIAVRLLSVVERRLESLSTNLLILDQAELERIRSQLEALRDEASFKIAFSEGWELSEEQTLELVEELFRGKDQPLT
jgi:tetratricopeptide (TPR) repeat protein